MFDSDEKFMQLFNAQGDPLYIKLLSGEAFWAVPLPYKVSSVAYLTHLADDGSPYFENLRTNEVSWNLPPETIMSINAKNTAISFQLMDRAETEFALRATYDEQLSADQMAKLDAYFENGEHGTDDETVTNNNIPAEESDAYEALFDNLRNVFEPAISNLDNLQDNIVVKTLDQVRSTVVKVS